MSSCRRFVPASLFRLVLGFANRPLANSAQICLGPINTPAVLDCHSEVLKRPSTYAVLETFRKISRYYFTNLTISLDRLVLNLSTIKPFSKYRIYQDTFEIYTFVNLLPIKKNENVNFVEIYS